MYLTVLLLLLAALTLAALPSSAQTSLRWTMRQRGDAGVRRQTVRWDPAKTAVILCDLWDKHWCEGATRRVGQMAPTVDRFLRALREKGVLVVHAPSDTLRFYEGTTARERAKNAPTAPAALANAWHSHNPDKEPPLPIDDSDGGCDDDPLCPQYGAWTRQHPAVAIFDQDALTDDGAETVNLFHARGIKNVLILGVHTNMCVLGRSFGIRRLVGLGYHVALVRDLTDTMYNSRQRPFVGHHRGTQLIVEHIERWWCPTITSDQILGGKPFAFTPEPRKPRVDTREATLRLPETDHHYRRVKGYIEEQPVAAYQHASAAAHEAFRDLKYGVRLHWGLYSIDAHPGESWPFLNASNAEKQRWQELYKTWNPVGFDAEEWMALFSRAGMKCFAFTSKHHEGFSMFDTKTRVRRRVNWTAPGGPAIEECDLAYSIRETPFGRDVVKELCDAAGRHGIKIDLYFSHPDWYDADFRPYNYHPLQTPDAKGRPQEYGNTLGETARFEMAPDVTAAERERMLSRHRQQLIELLTRYGKIDMLCLDQWMGRAIWPEMRETLLQIRKLQPDVMLRARGIGNYGDYYTPEGFVPGAKENTQLPWMVIHPLAGSFSYVADPERYHDGGWIIQNLIDTVAKGGNFMVGIGPDGQGRFHPKAIEALEEAGAWLRVNGAAIYATRPRPGMLWQEGEEVRFTRTKNGKAIFALLRTWPGTTLTLCSVRPRPGTPIRLLGERTPLPWRIDDAGALEISLPERLQSEAARPCRHAWVLRIEGDDNPVAATPRLVVEGDLLGESVRVRIEAAPGTTAHYAFDDKPLASVSPVATGAIVVRAGQTLRARAFAPGHAASPVVWIQSGTALIRFQPRDAATPEGWLADSGERFGERASGLQYGWSADHTAEVRRRTPGLFGTLCHFLEGAAWKIAVPNGLYEVAVTMGDATYESENSLRVNGEPFLTAVALRGTTQTVRKVLTVTSGQIVLDGASPGRKTKVVAVALTRAPL